MTDAALRFRERLRGGERLIGTFVKTAAPEIVEILGTAGFDFLVLDAEHAPFDRRDVGTALLAARSVGIPMLVRVPEIAPAPVLAALDDGAAGIVGPHVSSAAAASALVAAARYVGGRGYSNSPRAGGYGNSAMWDHVDAADAKTTVVAMIEEGAAIAAIEDILDVAGIDAVFVGRADLAVALDDRAAGMPRVADATGKVIATARARGVPAMLFVDDPAVVAVLADQGASAFILSSDQGLLKTGARQSLAPLRR